MHKRDFVAIALLITIFVVVRTWSRRAAPDTETPTAELAAHTTDRATDATTDRAPPAPSALSVCPVRDAPWVQETMHRGATQLGVDDDGVRWSGLLQRSMIHSLVSSAWGDVRAPVSWTHGILADVATGECSKSLLHERLQWRQGLTEMFEQLKDLSNEKDFKGSTTAPTSAHQTLDQQAKRMVSTATIAASPRSAAIDRAWAHFCQCHANAGRSVITLHMRHLPRLCSQCFPHDMERIRCWLLSTAECVTRHTRDVHQACMVINCRDLPYGQVAWLTTDLRLLRAAADVAARYPNIVGEVVFADMGFFARAALGALLHSPLVTYTGKITMTRQAAVGVARAWTR